MQTCIMAKSYYSRIGYDLHPVYGRNKNREPFLVGPSNEWEPRKKYFDNGSQQFLEYQSVLGNKNYPPENINPRSVVLPQTLPADGDNYWEMFGDCKVRELLD